MAGVAVVARSGAVADVGVDRLGTRRAVSRMGVVTPMTSVLTLSPVRTVDPGLGMTARSGSRDRGPVIVTARLVRIARV